MRGTHGQDAADALTPGAARAASRPVADVWMHSPRSLDDPRDPEDLGADDGLGVSVGNAISHEMLLRLRARQQIREFLRSVPRSESEASVAVVRVDGTTRLLTRGQFTTAIDRMRPRMRQIIRLAVEERWSRTRVCAYLQHISLKTLERDYVEAMDMLAQDL